jgi:hypothetical protein
MRTVLIWLRNVGFCEQGIEHSDPLTLTLSSLTTYIYVVPHS